MLTATVLITATEQLRGCLGPDNQLFGHISLSAAGSTQADLQSRSDTWNTGEAGLTSQGFKYHRGGVLLPTPMPTSEEQPHLLSYKQRRKEMLWP